MSKGNALTALKAKVNGLEAELASKEQALFTTRQSVAKAQQSIDLLVVEGKQALSVAQRSISDLRSVNAELRDAVQETQDKRDHYRRLLKVTLGLFATFAVLDTAFYLFLIWG